MKKKIIIITIIALILLVIGIGAMVLIPEIKYKSAIKWLNNISINYTYADEDYLKYMNYFDNNKEYKDNKNNIKQLKYVKAQFLLNQQNLDEAIMLFKELNDYNDSIKKVDEIIIMQKQKAYDIAVKEYENGNFADAKIKFGFVDDNYKEKNEYISKIEKISSIQGTYESGVMFVTISGWNITYGINPKYNQNSIKSTEFLLEESKIKYKESLGTSMEFEKEFKVDFENKELTDVITGAIYVYVSDSTEAPKTKKYPQIGMTASEVEDSIWGLPNTKNKDTYSWGTTEQWVYKNRGYIYFENGIVTSISER